MNNSLPGVSENYLSAPPKRRLKKHLKYPSISYDLFLQRPGSLLGGDRVQLLMSHDNLKDGEMRLYALELRINGRRVLGWAGKRAKGFLENNSK